VAIKYLGTHVCAVAEMGFLGEKNKEENEWLGWKLHVYWWKINHN
jgi:hypothetical protein